MGNAKTEGAQARRGTAGSRGRGAGWPVVRRHLRGLLAIALAVAGAARAADAAETSDVLLQGSVQVTVAIRGDDVSGATAVDFGPDVTVHGFTTQGKKKLSATVSVAHLATAGPRTFTITLPSGTETGTILVELPTNLLPVTSDVEPSQNAAMGGVGVFLAGGEFTHTTADHATRGRQAGITWTRTYQSNCAYNGPTGNGWTSYYFQRAVFRHGHGPPRIEWFTPAGRTEVFVRQAGAFTPPAGVYWTATRHDDTGEITLRHKHGHVCRFEGVDGRLVSCADANGNTVTLTHSANGQLSAITDDRGLQWTLEYWPHGRVRYLRDHVWSATSPRVIELGYSAAGDLTSVKMPETDRYRDSLGTRITYEYSYDASHRLLTCRNPREQASGGAPWLTNTYENGRVIQQQVGTTGQHVFLRYVSAAMVREVDRRGLRTDITLDALGRATAVAQHTGFWSVDTTAPIDHAAVTPTAGKLRSTDPAAFTTNYQLNSDHEITAITHPRGNTVAFTFQPVTTNPDVRGNVIEVRRRDEALGSEPDIVTQATYTATHQFLASSTDARGFTTSYVRDANGNLLRTILPTVTLGQPAPQSITLSATYLSDGRIQTRTDGEAFVTSYGYFTSGDQHGFLKQISVDTATLNLTTEFDTNRAGDVIARWSPRAFTTATRDDTFKTSFEVNELSQTWHVTGPIEFVGGTARSEVYRYFDANSLLVREYREYLRPDGTEPAAPSNPHDPATFPKSSAAMAATWVETAHAYNILDYRTSTTVDAIAGAPPTQLTTTFEYDSNYNQTALQTPLANRTVTAFDERDLVFTVKEGEGSAVEGTFRTDYDANGNVATQTDAVGNATAYVLDVFDRVARTTDGDLHYVTQSYDPDSNPLATSHFDAANTLLAQTTQFWDEINRSFKTERLARDRIGANIGDGLDTTTTLLDKNSRVSKVTDDNSIRTTFGYDGANRRTSSVDNLGSEANPTYNKDSAVTVTDYIEKNPLTLADEVSHTEALLDFRNRRIAWRDQRFNATTRDTQVDYALDGWGRVVVITDAASVETSYEYDLLSRKTTTTRKPTSTGSTWIITRHTWDDDSRLTHNRISTDGSAETGHQTTQYGYDARHRRTFTRLPDYVAAPESGVVTYSYDAQNPTGWTDLLGTTVADSFDGRNLITGRTITRGTGVFGATREAYAFDGLGRLTSAHSYQPVGATEGPMVLQSWTYNTLSHAETHNQQVHDHNGNLLGPTGGYTTSAGFDALGLTKTTGHATGLSLAHSYDGLNRLASTAISGGGATLATYTYSGPHRLIRRVYGNGNVTTVGYEVAGCPCGGFSAFVEDVRHDRSAADPTPLVRAERRYDVLGNVTAERWGHWGDQGSVFRYDDTYRLEDTYSGVDLSGSHLGTFADPSNTPSAFAMRRHYGLDTRGNRTGVTDQDDAATPNTLRTVAYNPDSNTNVYNTVDGQSFAYDAAEQLTFDPTTGLYTAYDYRGQPVFLDGDSDFSSPERVVTHDAHGRRRLEERWSGSTPLTAEVYTYLPEIGSPPVVADQIGFTGSGGTFAASGDDVAFVCGMGAAGSGGCGGATNPRTATRLPSGSTVGSFVIHERATDGSTTEERWILEDQLGSTLGITGANGEPVRMYHSTDYGLTTSQRMSFTSRAGDIASVSHTAGVTTLTLAMGATAPTGTAGQPIQGISSSACGTIIAITSTYIDVWDPNNTFSGLGSGRYYIGDASDPHAPVRDDPPTHSGSVTSMTVMGAVTHLHVAGADFSAVAPGQAIHLALTLNGGGPQHHWTEVLGVVGAPPDTLVVRTLPEYAANPPASFDLYAAFTGGVRNLCGHWGATATHAGGVTTLYAERFLPTNLVGMYVQLDLCAPQSFMITGVSGRTMTITGNFTSVVQVGDPFVILPTVGVDPATAAPYTGTLGTDTRYGWAGYFRLDPVTTQSGDNLAGGWLAWNRILLVGMDGQFGAWSTPDPAAKTWTNLQDYARQSPVGGRDSTALDSPDGGAGAAACRACCGQFDAWHRERTFYANWSWVQCMKKYFRAGRPSGGMKECDKAGKSALSRFYDQCKQLEAKCNAIKYQHFLGYTKGDMPTPPEGFEPYTEPPWIEHWIELSCSCNTRCWSDLGEWHDPAGPDEPPWANDNDHPDSGRIGKKVQPQSTRPLPKKW